MRTLRRRTLRTRRSSNELVADCEAFLTGRYAERVVERGGTVPVWAWTNLLAHGRETDLRSEIAKTDGQNSDRWRAARAYLATELLDGARRGRSLADVQRTVLVPLELELAAEPGAETWGRQRWVGAVRSALAERGRVPRS